MKRKGEYQKILFCILAVYALFVGIMNQQFFQLQTLFDLSKMTSTTLIVAVGLLVVMVSGGIDVSFMAIALFGSYTTIYIMIQNQIDSLAFAFAMSMCIGIGLGIVNAVLINWLKLPPFIITLGTQNLFHGVMTTFISDQSFGSGVLPSCLHEFGQGYLFKVGRIGLTLSIIPVILVCLITYYMMNYTMIGRGIVALGNSEESANRIGFQTNKLRWFIYGYSGALAGLMGIMYVAQINALYPNKLVGTELIVIAAVVIGGTHITGGKGTITGVILGVVLIALLNSTLILIGLSSSWNDLFVGVVLIIAVAISSYREKRKNKKQLIFVD